MLTRITAGAFLSYGDKILLMKRGLHKKLAPGLWAGIGGHMELADIKNPRELNLAETCFREIYEETGIIRQDIVNLKLKYITIRNADTEIRENFYFVGGVNAEVSLPKCDEGELHWVDKRDISELPMSVSVKKALTHWIFNPDNDEMFVVITNRKGDCAEIIEI